MAETVPAGPLAGARLSTIVIYTGALDEMVAFYQDVLGLEVEHQTENYVELRDSGGANVALHRGRAPGVGERHWFIEFRVEDIDAVAAALRARGVDVCAVSERSWGKEAAFADPDGNRIELEQPAGKQKASPPARVPHGAVRGCAARSV